MSSDSTNLRSDRARRPHPPGNILRMRQTGAQSFYKDGDYFDLINAGYNQLEPRPGIETLAAHKRARGVVKTNPGASLVDVGDGILCLEFHSKMNSLGEDAISMLFAGIEETERNFEAMIHRQRGRKLQRRRQSDAPAVDRAGRRLGRT